MACRSRSVSSLCRHGFNGFCKKQPTGALQDGLVFNSGLAVKRAPEVGGLVIEQIDYMKVIKHDGGPGQMPRDRAGIG